MPVSVQEFLNEKAAYYNHPDFVSGDPLSIPHRFSKKQDIEIAAFFSAIFSWGNRTTILRKSTELMDRMNGSPHEFISRASIKNLKKLKGFKHRTFTEDDLYYFIDFLSRHYGENDTLETAFSQWMKPGDANTENALNGFRAYFFKMEHLKRTEKHIASPIQKSSCKRLNMFLRWMVRNDDKGVDFGIWKSIRPAQLVCPLDVHVSRVSKKLGILQRKPADWIAALELTGFLKSLNKQDPVKYDFALFNLGILEKF